MEYKTISDIFYMMKETEEQNFNLDDIRLEAKARGDVLEVENILKVQSAMTTVILKYHSLICDYVHSKEALIDDFDDEIKEFLEENKYYPYDDWNDYKYSDEAIEEEKKEIFKEFIHTLHSAVVDDDFYSNDKQIQEFINRFSKIDLYLYILSK